MSRIFEVGDLVRVRDWDDMAREFGADDYSIHCEFHFTSYMKRFCGKEYRIDSIEDGRIRFGGRGSHNDYVWSSDMLELAYQDEPMPDLLPMEGLSFILGAQPDGA